MMNLHAKTSPGREILSDSELQKMSAWIVEESRPKEGDPRSHTRRRIRNLLGEYDIGTSVLRRFSSTYKKQEAWLEERRGEFEFKYKDLVEANERGDLIVERVGGKVVSFVILKEVKTLGENPYVSGEVYELGRAFTVPEERGKGHYTRIRARAIEHAKVNHPDASLITATNKEHIKKMNRKDGWNEIQFSEFLQVYGDEPQESPGWTAFYLSPNQNSHTRD